MRSFFGLLAGATLLLLVSCTDNLQETFIPHEGDVIELTAYVDNGVTTKTGIVDNGNGGKKVVWKSGNAISLFFNSGDNAIYNVVWENVYNSYVFYATAKQLLEAYRVTHDPTCMINLYALAANQK